MQRKRLVFIIFMTLVAVSQTTHCGPHEVPGPPCGSPCPPTCKIQKRIACVTVCIVDGCVCKEGYIRAENISSPCIPISECFEPAPVKCGPHEVFTKCDYTTCVAACNRLGPVHCPAEGIDCKSGCLCAKGYVRRCWEDPKSPCVRIEDCPCDE